MRKGQRKGRAMIKEGFSRERGGEESSREERGPGGVGFRGYR
jgi:hypothetical protein